MKFHQIQKESDEMKSKLMALLKSFKLTTTNKTSKIAAAPTSEPSSPRLSLTITPPPKIQRDSREVITTDNSNIYALGDVIREGKFGPVRMGELIGSADDDKEVETGKRFAIKLCCISKMEEMKSLEDPFSELEVLKEIGELAASTNNPHLVGLIDSCSVGDYLYLVMPLFEDGDLLDVLENKYQGCMPSSEVKKMFQQLLLALQGMQSKGLIHRDLSLENILFDEKKNIYGLCDYGLSMRVQKDESGKFAPLTNYHITGKTMYIAPEFWKRAKEIDGMAADVWSLGVILFMTLTGIAPFKRAHDQDSNYRLIQEKGLGEIFAESNLPVETMEGLCLVQQMLHVDPSQRPTVEHLLNHSWFN
jgi:serine/threonine protein kinase